MKRELLTITGALVILLGAGCAKPRVAPTPPRSDFVVLVPDPEDGHIGTATVSGAGGAVVELTQASEGTRVVHGQAPSAPAAVTAADVQRVFGGAMEARPIAPRQFLLYFETGSDSLTAESRAQLADIVAAVRARPAPDVTVIGHTDTTGDAASNVQLGSQRAALIRDLLVQNGLDPAQVEVASHGESDLLVPTPDNTEEPKNRRVEVTIR